MAKVKSVPTIRRTALNLNDASPFTHTLPNISPSGFDNSECWETKINSDCNICELSLNYSEISAKELSDDKLILYNSESLNGNDSANSLQLTQETDGQEKISGNGFRKLRIGTTDIMTPIPNTYYKSEPSDIPICDFTDKYLQSLVDVPINVSKSSHKTDFTHESDSANICYLIDSVSPSQSTLNTKSNYTPFLDCENHSFNNELLAFIESEAIQENISEKVPKYNCSAVSLDSNNINFDSKSLSELAESYLKSEELPVTSNKSASHIDSSMGSSFSVDNASPSVCKQLNSYLHETPTPENNSNTLNSILALITENEAGDCVKKDIKNDLNAKTKFCTVDHKSIMKNVDIDLYDIDFETEVRVSVTPPKSLKSIDNSNIVDTSMPESFCNFNLDINFTPVMKDDKDINKNGSNCVKSVTENFNSENLCGSFCSNIDVLDSALSNLLLENENLEQITGHSSLNFCDEKDSLVSITDDLNAMKMHDISVNKEGKKMLNATSQITDVSLNDCFEKNAIANVGVIKAFVNDSKPFNGESDILNSFLLEERISTLVPESPKVPKNAENLSNLWGSSVMSPSNIDSELCNSEFGFEAVAVDLEDEIEPDIDLNFCMRSPVPKKNYLSQSKDSGFDEADLEAIKSAIPSFQISSLDKKKKKGNFLQKDTPSLLSVAISCKLNLENSRKEKLKSTRKKLIKCSFPFHPNFNPAEKI